MEAINAEQLEQMQQEGRDFVLINVLPEEAFRERHIPDSINIPVGKKDFEKQVEEAAGSRDRTIVVYCANTECEASPQAAKRLERAGFTNVIDFTGGTQEWEQTSHRVASGAR